jgi:hypothetical protein
LEEAEEVKSYIKEDVLPLAERTWGTIANMARNYISQFSQPNLRELFSDSPGRVKIGPEEVIDRGLVLIVSLSPIMYGVSAEPFRSAIKRAFCDRILQRKHLVIWEEGEWREINQQRPILYVMDEFHTMLNARGRSSDAYFLDRAREFLCMCILATQGMSAISSVMSDSGMRNHLLNNCRTKFFFANDCPETMQYFELVVGTEETDITGTQYQRVPRAPRFRLSNHQFVAPRKFEPVGMTTGRGKKQRYSASTLGTLPNGEALVISKGHRITRFSMNPSDYGSGIRPTLPTFSAGLRAACQA